MNITTPEKTIISGGSNGGTVTAAVANLRPELFGVAIPKVPVTDMLRYQLFTGGNKWREEYGTSDEPQMFEILKSYSPIMNVKPVIYPAMLLITGDHDDRVVPSHSYKYLAEL
jgi:prolyl oligopeptidase